MRHTSHWIAHLIGITTLAAIVDPLLAAPQDKPTLHFLSPANGTTVRPGQQVTIKVTGSGTLSTIGLLAAPDFPGAAVMEPKGRPPWVLSLGIPLSTNPGVYSLTARGNPSSGDVVESDNEVQIDVEPAEIPPVSFSQRSLTIPLGHCVTIRNGSPRMCSQNLFVSGTYADGTDVTLNGSTRINWVSQAPSVVTVSEDGALLGVSPGSTKVMVFGGHTINVTVLDKRR